MEEMAQEQHRYETRGRSEVFTEFEDLIPRPMPLKDGRGLAYEFIVEERPEEFQEYIEERGPNE